MLSYLRSVSFSLLHIMEVTCSCIYLQKVLRVKSEMSHFSKKVTHVNSSYFSVKSRHQYHFSVFQCSESEVTDSYRLILARYVSRVEMYNGIWVFS